MKKNLKLLLKNKIIDFLLIIVMIILGAGYWIFAYKMATKNYPIIPAKTEYQEELPIIQMNSLIGIISPVEIRFESLGVLTISAYSSSPDETDNTPEITASNQKVRLGIVAHNCLDFGETILIDGTEYEVQDRMNKRWGCERIDVWMKSKEEAINFGIKQMEVVLLK